MGYLQRQHMTHANNSTPPLSSHFLFYFFLKRNSQEKSAKENTKRANEFKIHVDTHELSIMEH